MSDLRRPCTVARRAPLLALAVLAWAGLHGAAAAATLPEIRTSATNRVPACITAERLMAFLKSRNPRLDPRYKNLASFYKQSGETWRVRWDYAFFQMAVETNFLTYRRPDGRMGDVDPKQNNFAGIGTTGGGVPGDSFPDVKTGVLAQIQHLVVYSGETITAPVAPRTQLKQEHILLKSRELNRPVRFGDLARRWAADPKYGQAIEWAAESFRAQYCRGKPEETPKAEALPWASRTAAPDAAPAARIASSVERAETKPPQEHAQGASPVRTIWSRADGVPSRAQPALPAPPAKIPAPKQKPSPEKTAAKGPAAAKEVVMAEPAAEPPRPALSAPAASPMPPIADPQPAEEDTGPAFALLAPPAMLTLRAPSSQSAAPALPALTPQRSPSVEAAGKPNFDPVAKPPAGLGVKPATCGIDSASFGGTKAVLIRTARGADVRFFAVSVLDGFEKTMTASFIEARAAGGEVLGEFPTKDAALAKARELCPSS